MLDELLGEWLDKRKIRRELCKAYKIYRDKAYLLLYSSYYTDTEYKQFKDIECAIAYVLCEYFDFNYQFYYDDFPFNYKWYIACDYIKYYEECKEAYIKFVKENESSLVRGNDIMYVMGTDDLQKTIKKMYDCHSNHVHMIYDIEHDYMYWKDKHDNIWKRC